jgi:TolB-like protein
LLKASLLTIVLLHAAEKPKLVVTEFASSGGVEKETAALLADAVATEVNTRGFFEPLTAKDVQTLIGLERQKQLLGCSEDSSACLTELAGALGAPNVLSGSIGRLGDAYQLNLQMLDARKAQVVGRSTRIARDLDGVRAQIPYAVAEATGTPLPPPPSRILPYTLIGAGALAIVVGGVLETGAFTRYSEVNDELTRAETNPSVRLQTREFYVTRDQQIRSQMTLGLLGLGVGVALLGVGIALNPADVSAGGGAQKLSFLVGPSGVGVAGALP